MNPDDEASMKDQVYDNVEPTSESAPAIYQKQMSRFTLNTGAVAHTTKIWECRWS